MTDRRVPKTSGAASSRRSTGRSVLRRVISARRGVQLTVGVAVYLLAVRYDVPLSWVILGGSGLGIVFGKFFCRWMCPMGAIIETLLGAGGGEDRQQSLYMYFKLGCPIAWAGGLLNKVSLLGIKLKPELCTDCGRCDRTCYVVQLSPGASLHRAGEVNASTRYPCSRCLECVGACPTGALTIAVAGVGDRTLPARPGRRDRAA